MNKEELLKKVSNWLVQLEQTNLNYVSEEEAESIRSEWQQKSYEVLQWVAAILQEDPFCFDAILARIKINCWVLENNAAILTDAMPKTGSRSVRSFWLNFRVVHVL